MRMVDGIVRTFTNVSMFKSFKKNQISIAHWIPWFIVIQQKIEL